MAIPEEGMCVDTRILFYKETVSALIPDRDAAILVVGAGANDRDVFLALGFSNVVMSDLDPRIKVDDYQPFQWSQQDMEHLDYCDNEFDYVVTHAALHHCSSPHRALLEMYRVARRAVVAIEARDSFVMKMIERIGLTQPYEHAAVYYNECKYGGVNNTDIPNYIYRWTEREVEKTVNSFNSSSRHRISYRYGYDLPRTVALVRHSGLKSLLVLVILPLYRLFVLIFPKQKNLFGFRIEKPVLPDDLHPWLVVDGGKIKFNDEWGKSVYKN